MEQQPNAGESTMKLQTFRFGFLALLALSCSKSAPAPEKEPLAISSIPTVAPSSSAALTPVQAPKDALPLLVPDKPIEATKGFGFYAIDGAFIVVDGLRVGRYVDDKVEWLGAVPKLNEAFGGSHIDTVTGVWPDVDVHYSSDNGRAAQPSVYPLTGKGREVMFAPGGGLGWIAGSVRLGKTTLVAGVDYYLGSRFETLRGPTITISPKAAEDAGCDLAKLSEHDTQKIAVRFSAVAVTGKGNLVTVGHLCDDRTRPAAEIWDQPGKSRIVELGDLLHHLDYFPKLFVGKGDEFWLVSRDIIHYLDGKFEKLPLPTHALTTVFVSATGKLHGIANRELLRYDDGKWTPIARVPRGTKYSTIVMDEAGTIWVANGGIAKLREAREDEKEAPCKTPFVYLYEVSWKNENKYTFPSTRKALASFPDVAKIKLVEYRDWGRKLGVQVESEEQGEAVIKHIKANMKDEFPELVCLVPATPRFIDINDGK